MIKKKPQQNIKITDFDVFLYFSSLSFHIPYQFLVPSLSCTDFKTISICKVLASSTDSISYPQVV